MTATPSSHRLEERRGSGDAATLAALDFLAALSVDTDAPDVREAAAGMADLYRDLLTPEPVELTTFDNDGGYDELVVVRDIEFTALCTCHVVPYTGRAHVAYVPGARIVGLSKIGRGVEHLARAIQAPQRLAQRVADWLDARLAPARAGVVVESEPCDGPTRVRGRETTTALRGRLRDDPATQREFLALSSESRRR